MHCCRLLQFALAARRGLVQGLQPFLRSEAPTAEHWAVLAATLTSLAQFVDVPRDAGQTK